MPVPSPDEKGGGLGREYSTLPVKLTWAAVQLGSLLHGAERRQPLHHARVLMANPQHTRNLLDYKNTKRARRMAGSLQNLDTVGCKRNGLSKSIRIMLSYLEGETSQCSRIWVLYDEKRFRQTEIPRAAVGRMKTQVSGYASRLPMWVHTQGSPHGICGGQSGAVEGFSLRTSIFPCQISFHQWSVHSSIIWCWCNGPICGPSTNGLSLTPCQPLTHFPNKRYISVAELQQLG
jgi:hypothetical protein